MRFVKIILQRNEIRKQINETIDEIFFLIFIISYFKIV